MPDLGIDVLFKGTNMLRLLQGLWVAMKISIVSILISMPLGILVGALMTVKNRFVKAIFRVYLEFIRIMPQLGRDSVHHRVCPVGHRRDGRSGAWSADQYSEASVRKQ